MRGFLTIAAEADAAAIAALQNAVASELTGRFGIGHWSSVATERGVRASMKRASIQMRTRMITMPRLVSGASIKPMLF